MSTEQGDTAARLSAAERGLEEAESLLDSYHRTLTGPVGWSLSAIGAAPAEGVEHTLDAIERWCAQHHRYSTVAEAAVDKEDQTQVTEHPNNSTNAGDSA